MSFEVTQVPDGAIPMIKLQHYIRSESVNASIDALPGQVLLVDATSGAVTVRLPDAREFPNVFFYVKKVDGSGNAVTVDAFSSDNIEGSGTASLSNQYDSASLISSGSEWFLF